MKPGDIVLDAYLGSGTTAAVLLSISGITIPPRKSPL